jgi:hypothetical protein
MPIRRILAAVLALAAFAVPTAAVAQPPDMHASTAIAAAKAQQQQDLRSPDARHAALLANRHGSTDSAPAKVQDLRSPDAIDAAVHPRKSPVVVDAPGATVVDSQAKSTPVAPGQPTWAVHPKQLPPPAQPATAAKGDDGVEWTTIGIGVGLTLLLVGGVAAVTARTRPTPRTRAA